MEDNDVGRNNSIIAEDYTHNSEQIQRKNREGFPERTTRSRSQLRAARDKVSQKKNLDRLRENHEDSSKRCY